MKRLALLLLIVLLSALPAVAEPYDTAVKLRDLFVNGDHEGLQAAIKERPDEARQAFEYLWGEMQANRLHPDQRIPAGIVLSFIAVTLQEQNFLERLPQAPQVLQEVAFRRELGAIIIAYSLDNYRETLPRVTAILEKYSHISNVSDPDVMATLRLVNLRAQEALGHSSEVLAAGATVAREIEALKVPEPQNTLRKMDLAMILARAARRVARPKLEEQYLQEAKRLAETVDTPASHVTRFVITSQLQRLELLRGQELTDAQLIARHDQAFADLARVPPVPQATDAVGYWYLAIDAARFWMETLYEHAQALPAGSAARAELESRAEKSVLTFVERMEQMDLEAVEPLERVGDQWIELSQALSQVPLELAWGSTDLLLDVAAVNRSQADIAGAKQRLALAHSVLHDWAEIVPEYVEVSAILAPGSDLSKGTSLDRLWGRYYEELGLLESDPHKGVAALQKAREHYSKGNDELPLTRVGPRLSLALWTAGSADALKEADAALAASQALASRPGTIEAYLARGYVRAETGDRAGAIKDLEAGIALLEEFILELGGTTGASERIRSTVRTAYNLLARLKLETGHNEDAFLTLQRGAQAESVAGFDVQQVAPEKAAELEQVRLRAESLEQELQAQKSLPANAELEQRIARTSKLLAQTRGEFVQVRDSLKKELGPAYDRYLAVSPMDLARVQKDIPADTALVQAFFTPESQKLYLFVITSDQFRVRAVETTAQELDTLVKNARRQMLASVKGTFSWSDPATGGALKPALTQLHAILIDPIEPDLEGKKVIAFIPSGVLNYLPLQALARPRGDGMEFLIERRQVVTLTRASDLVELSRAAGARGEEMVAFGNPDGSLPAAGQEVQHLAALFPGARVFTEGKATEKELLAAQDIGYLHLATHGVLDSRDPDASYLVMAGPDARLTRYEIIDSLDLRGSRLVTLSACETQLGERNPGNEVTSIAESFWVAGTPAVLGSLWRVSDESTRELMTEFYRQVQAEQSLGAALQAAQLKLLRDPKYASPFYWAPFVLWGDWR